jgi:hypothetical protein
MQLNLNDLNIAKAYIERRLANSEIVNEKYGTFEDNNKQTVIPAYDTDPGVEYDWDQVTYYVKPDYTSPSQYNRAQADDADACRYDSYFMTNLLTYKYGSIDKKANWIGYTSEGMCEWRAEHRFFFEPSHDAKYDDDNVCRLD